MLKVQNPEKLYIIPLICFLGLFEIYPITRVAYTSLTNVAGNFTFDNYIAIFQQKQFWISVRNSVGFATVLTLVGAIGGTFVGYFTPILPKKIQNFLLSIYSIPNSLSGLVVAFAFIILLGHNGVVNLIIQKIFSLPHDRYFDIYSWPGLILVYAFFMIPLMTLTMAGVFKNLDVSLVEAAQNLGARPWQVWQFVIIPIMAPGLIAGMSIQLAAMLGAFGTVLALTGASKNLLSIQIFFQMSEGTYDLAQSDSMAVVLILLITIGLVGLRLLERKIRK